MDRRGHGHLAHTKDIQNLDSMYRSKDRENGRRKKKKRIEREGRNERPPIDEMSRERGGRTGEFRILSPSLSFGVSSEMLAF